MTQPIPPYQYQYAYPPYRQPSNGIGIAGFVLGLLGLLFAWAVVFGTVLLILGTTFSAMGVHRANKLGAGYRGLAVAGLVLAVIGDVLHVFAWAVLLAPAGA